MSEGLAMFNCRQIIQHDLPVEIPDCMYKMKNILDPKGSILSENKTANLDISQQVMKFLKSELSSEMSALQIHQEKILKQLEELKKQMLNLKDILKIPNASVSLKNTEVSKCDENFSGKTGKIYDFVINVNPANPPYSLLILQKLWSNKLNIIVKSFVHSSMTSLPEIASEFAKMLESGCSNTNSAHIFVRLIWKNIDDSMVFITSNNTPIYGEVNFLRYLSRVGPKEFNYELLKNVCEVDSIMDMCYLLSKSRTKTERHSLLQNINSRLGKSQWLCNNNISIADVAASSVIKQTMCGNEVNVNLTKWMNRCEKI